VAKHYGALKVLQGIDLEAHAGELVGLIGPNGAGKTTLMRCMSDGAERSAGTVKLCGHDIRALPPEACVRFGLGRKFQNANIFESLTVAQCLRIAGTLLEKPSLLRQDATLRLPAYALDVLRATGLDAPSCPPSRATSRTASSRRSNSRWSWRWSRASCCSTSPRRA
jgi:branched-chain amino acid transport system permease protein